MFSYAQWVPWVSSFLGAVTGFCLYVYIKNRFIFGLPESPAKVLISVLSLLLLSGGLALAGYFDGLAVWLLVLFGVCLAGEVLRIVRVRNLEIEDEKSENKAGMRPKWITTTALQVLRYRLPVAADWSRPIRIVHTSDWHFSPQLLHSYWQRVVETLAQAEADLLFLTGDFVTHARDARFISEYLSRDLARLGTFAVLGNHDYWEQPDEIRSHLTSAGATLLTNTSVLLDPLPGTPLLICGCDDPWGAESWQPPRAPKQSIKLCLSHTPDNIYRLSGWGADAVFSGHFHAGHVRFPFLGALLIPSAYGRRFVHGHFRVNQTHLYVSAGIGSVVPSQRILCPPDIMIIDLIPAHLPDDNIRVGERTGREPVGDHR
jgi:hypothetical protein